MESRKEACDGAVSEYLEKLSKKTESQAGGCRELVGKVYRIECELGEIATNSHKAKDSGRDFFETKLRAKGSNPTDSGN